MYKALPGKAPVHVARARRLPGRVPVGCALLEGHLGSARLLRRRRLCLRARPRKREHGARSRHAARELRSGMRRVHRKLDDDHLRDIGLRAAELRLAARPVDGRPLPCWDVPRHLAAILLRICHRLSGSVARHVEPRGRLLRRLRLEGEPGCLHCMSHAEFSVPIKSVLDVVSVGGPHRQRPGYVFLQAMARFKGKSRLLPYSLDTLDDHIKRPSDTSNTYSNTVYMYAGWRAYPPRTRGIF